jgi:hypothetical protein
MSQELIVSTASLAVTLTQGLEKANDLLAQGKRAEIAERKDYENGTDFRKVVSGIRKRLEDQRKGLVDPYGKRVRSINAEFKKVRDVLDQADDQVKGKMTVWHNVEEKRQRDLQEKQRQEQEETDLAAAQEAEEAGDLATSEAILNMASEVPEPEAKPSIGRGSLTGAASVATKVWTGEVHSVSNACLAIAKGALPADLVTFSQSKLNALAREWHEKQPDAEEIAQHGITVKGETRLSVR